MAIVEKNKYRNRVNYIEGNPNTVLKGKLGDVVIDNLTSKRYKSGGGNVWYEDIVEVESFIKLKEINNYKINDTIFVKSYYGDNKGGGGRVKKTAEGQLPSLDNGGTIFIATNGDRWDRVLENDKIIDIKLFGAIDGVKFSDLKEPIITPGSDPLANIPDASSAINRAITWLDRNRVVFPSSAITFKLEPSKLIINGHYLINPTGLNPATDIAIKVPNGISIECVGQSSLHTNYDGISILLNEHYGTNNKIRIFRKLWLGAFGMIDWYTKTGNTEPVDKYSAGVVLNSSRRTTLDISAWGFVYGCRLDDDSTLSVNSDGCVQNTINIGMLRENRYGLALYTNDGGWINQNIINGGEIKFTGTYNNRHATIKTPCAAILLQGNNNIFNNVNLESTSFSYQYAIDETAGNNVYINLRMESINSANAFSNNNANSGSIFIGGYGSKTGATGGVSIYDNIELLNVDGKIDFLKTVSTRMADLSGGQLRLTGDLIEPSIPTSTLQVHNTLSKEDLFALGRDKHRFKHLFYGQDGAGKIEFHTNGVNDYVNIKELHIRNGIYNLEVFVSSKYYGIGDWFDDTATSGNWYFATKLFKSSATLQLDVANGNLQIEPVSSYPTMFEDGGIATQNYYGSDLNGTKSPANLPAGLETNEIIPKGSNTTFTGWNNKTLEIKNIMYANYIYGINGYPTRMNAGIMDDHNYATVVSTSQPISRVDFSSDILNFDMFKKNRTLFLNNTSGSAKFIRFNKSVLNSKFKGAEFLFFASTTPISSPILFENTTDSIRTLDENDITLKSGEWIIVRLIRDSGNNYSFREITRSNIKSYKYSSLINASLIDLTYLDVYNATTPSIAKAFTYKNPKVLGNSIVFIDTTGETDFSNYTLKDEATGLINATHLIDSSDVFAVGTFKMMVISYNGIDVFYWFVKHS